MFRFGKTNKDVQIGNYLQTCSIFYNLDMSGSRTGVTIRALFEGAL
jgi:hypothetical protein